MTLRKLIAIGMALPFLACREPMPTSSGGIEASSIEHLDIPPPTTQVTERLVATWYGMKFHGRMQANGQRFSVHAMTVAHRSLPFGTKVKIRNPANGREVVATVSDRGPYVRGRGLDCSPAVALSLGIYVAGKAVVEMTVIERNTNG